MQLHALHVRRAGSTSALIKLSSVCPSINGKKNGKALFKATALEFVCICHSIEQTTHMLSGFQIASGSSNNHYGNPLIGRSYDHVTLICYGRWFVVMPARPQEKKNNEIIIIINPKYGDFWILEPFKNIYNVKAAFTKAIHAILCRTWQKSNLRPKHETLINLSSFPINKKILFLIMYKLTYYKWNQTVVIRYSNILFYFFLGSKLYILGGML